VSSFNTDFEDTVQRAQIALSSMLNKSPTDEALSAHELVCIHKLREKGYSFEQITKVLNTVNNDADNKLDAETVCDFYNEALEKRISRFFEEYGEFGRTLLRSKFTIAEPTPEATEAPLCLSQNICPAPPHWVADNPLEFFLDVSLEHPSIPGLMLSREQRMSYDELEYLMNGKQARESLRQKVARIKWVQIEKK
jgi:DNA-binding transcriptional MerR regulator